MSSAMASTTTSGTVVIKGTRLEGTTAALVRRTSHGEGTLLPLAVGERTSGDPGLREEIECSARKKGYEEGWQRGHAQGQIEGREMGAAAAREEVLAQAQGIVARAEEEARQAAHKLALEQAERAWAQAWAPNQARLDALLANVSGQVDARVNAAQDDILCLCMETVTRILGDLAVQPQHIRGVLEQAMQDLKTRPLLSVEMHEADYAALQALPTWNDWASTHAGEVQWIKSSQLAAGGCIVRSPNGSLDARLDTQLRAFQSILRASREEYAAGSPTPSEGSAS